MGIAPALPMSDALLSLSTLPYQKGCASTLDYERTWHYLASVEPTKCLLSLWWKHFWWWHLNVSATSSVDDEWNYSANSGVSLQITSRILQLLFIREIRIIMMLSRWFYNLPLWKRILPLDKATTQAYEKGLFFSVFFVIIQVYTVYILPWKIFPFFLFSQDIL